MLDLLCLIFALAGIVFILYYIMFKLFMWGEKGGVFVISLYPSEKEPRTRIKNIKKLLELIGFDKISTMLIVDCGILKSDMELIKNTYVNDEKVFFCNEDEVFGVLDVLSKRHE